MMKGCLNLLCLVLLSLLDEVEASNLTASAGTIALAICYLLILVAGIILLIKYRKECKCKRQNEEPTTTIRNVQQLSPITLQRPEFNQTTYPQRSASLHVQPPPPGTALLLELHVGEPPPPYPGM